MPVTIARMDAPYRTEWTSQPAAQPHGPARPAGFL